MPKIPPKVYQLKITLEDSKPPIWRRFLIANSVSLPELHKTIQIIMGWQNYHLHQFVKKNRYYGIPDPDFNFSETLDERRYKLGQLLKKENDSLMYDYDFGDDWEHNIILEKILPIDPKITLPYCIKARRACPPEDVGGIWGYRNFLKAINDPDHPEHDEYLEWIGFDFDPTECDLDEINEYLLEYFK